ncbi:MAG: hypothetical protein KF683_05555, partial [Rubrivivax sp.]|nr:hypothetical protein [Rubrivivax sp.]
MPVDISIGPTRVERTATLGLVSAGGWRFAAHCGRSLRGLRPERRARRYPLPAQGSAVAAFGVD